jgi:predicted RNA-binding Zn-ribbon protein involved in translation (DUF1610 family)
MFSVQTVRCESCGQVVRRKRHAQQHCSPKCRQAAYRRRKARVTLRRTRQVGEGEKRNAALSGGGAE